MDVILIGAGGHGQVVLDILRAGGQHKPIGFLDADPALAGQTVGGIPVLGRLNMLPKLRGQIRGAIVSIGDNHTRRACAAKVAEQGIELINAIHPRSIIAAATRFGRNIVVAAGAVVCTEAEIGDDCIINTSAVVEHECRLGVGVHVCPAAAMAGRVRVGDEAFLGLGCRIIQCLSIGSRSVVGAGAVVTHDVPDGATVVGVPARVLRMTPSIPQIVS